MSVTLTITSGCTVSTTPLNFGTAQALTSPLSASTTISPICTNSTPYNIGIDQGAGSGASVTTRVMTGTTVSDTVNYSIYKDAAHSIVWGNTIGTNTFPGTGTGASQSIPVYGLVSAQASVPDSYADVVNVTITY